MSPGIVTPHRNRFSEPATVPLVERVATVLETPSSVERHGDDG